MPENSNNNQIDNFSDLDDEIIIKGDDGFQVFSSGNFSDLDSKNLEKSKQSNTALVDTGMEEELLAPITPTKWSKETAFYFDFEDQDEINRYKKKTEEFNKIERKKYSITKIIQKLIENNNLNFVAELEKKFSSIVLSFLKHTREKLDVFKIFKTPINQMGMGLDETTANRLVGTLVSIREKIEEVQGIILDDIVAEKKQVDQKPSLSNLDPRQKVELRSETPRIPFVERINNPNKTKISDVNIKRKNSVISPVEELGEVSLTIFRRLSNNPIEAAQRIINKIYSFEKESFIKRAMAVKYWRQSEVYKLYLEIGRSSMEKNIPIEKIIETRILANEKTLTNEEFRAISDLNKKIRF